MVMVMVQLFSPDSESFSLFTFFPPPELVHDDDLTVGFIRLNNLPAMFAIEVNNGQEYVLCFNGKSKSRTQYITHHIHCTTSNMYDGECLWLLEDDVSFFCAVVGVYVNNQGQRSRKQELIWHSPPSNFG